MATSRVSRGKLLVNMKKGESVPDDWALAIDGSRTTDAAQAFRGILLPLGYKGYGMAVIVDMLSGVLKRLRRRGRYAEGQAHRRQQLPRHQDRGIL